jgi:hypothetical protein
MGLLLYRQVHVDEQRLTDFDLDFDLDFVLDFVLDFDLDFDFDLKIEVF